MAEELVQQLRQAALDAINRGFSILVCGIKEKDPWAKYSPHAVNSCSRVLDPADPNYALRAWDDGHAANFGVGGGPSNLTIVDVDKGIPNQTALKNWMESVGLPETFTVQTGRDGEFGAHLYYSGAVKTTPYVLEGVVGELRGTGAYVVGPGSVHPSGKLYKIIKDVPIASLPQGMVDLAVAKTKSMANYKPGIDGLIPEGNRWAHLQAKAGTFKNLGLDEKGIYDALKNFCTNNCENGDNYPDDKIVQLAEWAASPECEGIEPAKLLTFGSPDPEADSTIAEMPSSAIEGDYLGDLAGAITEGTFIPPSFARADLKTLMGAVLDGKIAFPGEETIHTRHWTGIISSRPGAGKSMCWTRLIQLLSDLLTKYEIKFPPAGFMSSGEHAIKVLSEHDGKSHVIYFDEMKALFEKGNNGGSTLFPKLLELYEQKASAVGSLTHGGSSFNDISLSMAGNFTRAGFDRSVSGKGAGGDGFLSRMVLDYSDNMAYQGDWAPMDTVKVNAAIKSITESLHWIANYVGETNKGKPFIPEETEGGHDARMKFQHWLAAEKARIQKEHPDASYVARLESHFKRDLLIRVAFTPERKITEAVVNRSWAWAKHQLMLCEELWPVDNGGPVEKFEKRIIHAITKNGPLTKAGLQKFSNADKGEGGFGSWNIAFRSLCQADKIIIMPSAKSDRGKDKFGFDEATWSKKKSKWIFGNPNA